MLLCSVYTNHERCSEFVAEECVDERIHSTVSEPDEVRRQHREEKVLLQQETVFLHLSDERHQIERRPEQQERCCHDHNHTRYLQTRTTQQNISVHSAKFIDDAINNTAQYKRSTQTILSFLY